MTSHDSGHRLAARFELADLIDEAAGGMSDCDRAVLELAYRHGLEGVDLAAALEVSVAQARTMAVRVRQMVERSLGALLVARRVRRNPGLCLELAVILNAWNGDFTAPMRKRVIGHVERCFACELERRRLVTPAALLGTPPVFVPAPDWLRASTLRRIRLIPAPGILTLVPPVIDSPAREHRGSRKLVALVSLLALLVATVVTGRGLSFESPRQQTSNLGQATQSVTIPRSALPATTFAVPPTAPAHPTKPAPGPTPVPARASAPSVVIRTPEPAPEPVRQPAPRVNSTPSDAVVLRAATTDRAVITTPQKTAVVAAPQSRPGPPGTPGRHRDRPKTAPPAEPPEADDDVS